VPLKQKFPEALVTNRHNQKPGFKVQFETLMTDVTVLQLNQFRQKIVPHRCYGTPLDERDMGF